MQPGGAYHGGRPERRLETWKEIAAYCGVNVRTAQLWEAERGLPVYRQTGLKGRVWAWEREVDAWRESFLSGGSRTLAEIPPTPWWRRWPAWAWLASASAVAAMVLIVISPLAKLGVGEMTDYRVEGAVLIARDAHGRTVWRHIFPMRVDQQSGIPNDATFSLGRVADLDRDGKPELIFPARTPNTTDDVLYCFEADGRLRWQYRPLLVLQTKQKSILPVYRVRVVRLLAHSGGTADVLAIFSHDQDDASTLVRLSRDGHVLGQYWHTGHLGIIETADLDGDGHDEIYTGGCANADGAADLAVLDPERMNGSSREPTGVDQLPVAPIGPERVRLLLPRTELGLEIGLYACASRIWIKPSGVAVELEDGGIEYPAGTYYLHLSRQLVPVSAWFSDRLRLSYRQFHAQGRLRRSSPDGEQARLMQVRRIGNSR